MRILGISAFYHDSAAALIVDGQIVAAAQEERFTRKKHDSGFPACAVQFCLDYAGIALSEVDFVAFYDKPLLKFERLLESYMSFAPAGVRSFCMSMPLWIREKLFQKDLLAGELAGLAQDRILFAEHHLSHAASAFYPSPFERAAVLTMDGVGEWATTSVAVGDGASLRIEKEIHFPHSLGLLYSAFTYYTGFKVNSGEYKLMGLAPYGRPRFAQKILDHLIDLKSDGSFRLNMEYFRYATGLQMTEDRRFAELFGVPRRLSEEQPLTQEHMDLAASVQQVLEEAVLRLGRSLAADGHRNLCLAGGVALNCVANGKLQRAGLFDGIWIQPAAGDAGGALGAALAAYHLEHLNDRSVDTMQNAFLGPSFSQAEVERRLTAAGARFTVCADDEALLEACVKALLEQKAVGWMQGRMEFGPRALGARSILADPRSAAMQSVLNLKVKFRESFRPFAPSVLREHVADWFEFHGDSPYMLMTVPVAEGRRVAAGPQQEALFGIEKLKVARSEVPAVTHVDYSARIQTVSRETNPKYYALIERFYECTGCPMLVNTSFNVRGEPIVHSPEDAFRCFMGTGIEVLAVGNCLLRKEEQDPGLQRTYQHSLVPD
jgi:carbamoyltransferase